MEIEEKETRLSGLRAWEWVRRKNEGLVARKKFLTEPCLTSKECLGWVLRSGPSSDSISILACTIPL